MDERCFSWLYASFILAVFGQVSLGKIKGFLQLNSPTNLPEMSCFLTDLCAFQCSRNIVISYKPET